MGEALERRAGSRLQSLLGKLAGLFTGMAVTAVIQSSSAITVMVVSFVNSGLMNLGQAISVIMGANIGATGTAWILSLGGIETGFFGSDLLTDLGRVSDHCSNIAGGVMDLQQQMMNIHEAQRAMKSESEEYRMLYKGYKAKYLENV